MRLVLQRVCRAFISLYVFAVDAGMCVRLMLHSLRMLLLFLCGGCVSGRVYGYCVLVCVCGLRWYVCVWLMLQSLRVLLLFLCAVDAPARV